MSSDVKPNFLKPRWSKVVSDLWDDKTRTTLVVASIAVGVFAVGMIVSTFTILSNDINASFASINPANIEVRTDPFHDNLIRVIDEIPGVEDVEGRYVISVRARKKTGPWFSFALIGMDDFGRNQINLVETIEGTQIPGKDEIVVSKDMRANTGFQVGDEIQVELPDGSLQILTVAGLVTDQSTAQPDPSAADGNIFVTLETLRAFGLGEYNNRLLVTVEGNGSDEAFISDVAAIVEEKVERNNREVYQVNEQLSTVHPMSDSILAIIGVLGALGILITVLSGSLIINTLNAMMTQQLRQIGVMKLIGGLSNQILGMYLTLIIAYSVIALVLAVPLGALAGYGLASFIAGLMGAVLLGFRFIPAAIVMQVIIAFLIPLASGFVPVNRGSKTNVRRAISNYRPGNQSSGRSFLNQSGAWVRWISRPILLSFRNTFRKTGRLLLTIFTLTVAGAVFIAVFNVRASMNSVMQQVIQHFMGDVTLAFNQPYNVDQIERVLITNVPGVVGVEGWGGARGEIWDEDDDLVTALAITAPPQDTQLLDPEFVAGRWLLPGEKNAMVVSDSIYNFFPDLVPGDTLKVKIPGVQKEEWTVVGVFLFVDMLGDPMAYANFEFIADKVNLPNQSFSFRIITEEHDIASQLDLTKRIDIFLADRNYKVRSIETGASLQESATMAVDTLVSFLLIMAILTAFVGSIGLTGTMSINVLERTREIGVMRTIGAVDFVIMQSVIIEALVIGMITWFLAIGLSFPISTALLTIIGETMMGSAMTLVFTPTGLLLWLGIVIVLSIIASVMPARNAARLTINEVLAYE
jgi:putative ABC transport system permease protein